MTDSEEDAVLNEASGLIEQVYAFHDGGPRDGAFRRPRGRPRRRLDHRDKVAELEDAAAVLRGILVSIHEERRGDEMTRIWEDIAMNQSEQRELALGENKQLRETVREQQAVSKRVCKLVSQSLDIAMNSCLGWTSSESSTAQFELDEPSPDIPALCSRLDRMSETNLFEWSCPRPPVGTPFWDRASECTDSIRELHIRNRYASYFPSKLSTIVDEVWNFLGGKQSEREEMNHEHDEKRKRYVYRVIKPYGKVECFGHTVVRRMFKADGSVLFTWTSIGRCNPSESHTNLMAGLEMHEMGYAHVRRISTSSQRPVVLVELVGLREVKAPNGAGESLWPQLKRMEEFMERAAGENNAMNWQKLENRFVDASRKEVRVMQVE